jgi:CRP-like cAMP-binding protein
VKPDIQFFLARLTSHSRLNKAEQGALLELPTQVMLVEGNKDFVRLGETVRDLSVLVDGVVARFGQNADGERQITALFIAGDAPDLHLVVVPRDTAPLQALSNSTILRIPHAALRGVAARYPAVAEAFWRHCSIDAATTARWVVNLGRQDAPTRLAHLLCEMAVRCDAVTAGKEITFPFPLTQNHLADATGLTVVHINRTLKALASEGLLHLSQRTARIPDWQKLARRGDFNEGYLRAGIQRQERLRLVD